MSLKREIRPLEYRADVQDVQGTLCLVIVHPLEGDVMIYGLDPDTKKRLHAGTGPGLEVVGAEALPRERPI